MRQRPAALQTGWRLVRRQLQARGGSGLENLAPDADALKLLQDQPGLAFGHVDQRMALMDVDRADDPTPADG